MKKEMLINVLQPEECRIAIVEDGVLEELYVERTSHESYTGNIYKGRIVNLEPAIQAAFVDFSVGRNGFLHVSDVEPQYYHRHQADEADASPREPRRDRPDRGRSRAEGRGAGGPPPDRGDERSRDRPERPERPDRSERGRRDRSEPRRFGEGLVDDDWTPPPPPPPRPVEPPPRVEPERAGRDRDEGRRARPEPSLPSWFEAEAPPREARAPEAEPRDRVGRPAEPYDPDLPPSRTQRSRMPSPPPRPSELDIEEPGRSRTSPEPFDIETAEGPPAAREPRRSRGRGRPSRAAAEPEVSFGAEVEPEPIEGEVVPEADFGDQAEPPRRRGGRAAIRSRGGDRPAAPERPRGPAPERPLDFEEERAEEAEAERPRPAEPERPRDRPRGADRGRAAEPDVAPRERPRSHARAGEPGYIPRRERSRPTDSGAGAEPPPSFHWADLADELGAGPEAGTEEAETAGEKLDEPRRRRRRRGRRRDRDRPETAAPASAEDLESVAEDLLTGAGARPPRDFAGHGAELESPSMEDFDFGEEAVVEGYEEDVEALSDELREEGAPAAAEEEIDPELEEEIRREVAEIAELEREMGLRGPVEARPRRGDEREAEAARPEGRFTRGRGLAKPPIQEVFRRGDEVLVQVIKESIGTKGPTLSTYISIPGRYLVLMPGLNRVGVSRKIADESQRRKLREIMNELNPPKGLGFIVRTAGLERSKRELARDLAYLLRLWKVILRRIKKARTPAPIYQESDMITRTIRDIFTSEIDTIWIDEPSAFERAQEFLRVVMPRFVDRLKLYDEKVPLFHKYGIEDEIAKIQRRRVDLREGGSIVIDQTEALVAIDVNSGNFRVENDAEKTAYEMNLRAAKEIARQLRLRDLGGVIVNDFIDMREEKHRRGVEKALRDAIKRDRARSKVLRMSAFGLIEMTRQRIRPSLKRSVYEDCPHCAGAGVVKTVESMSIDVMRLLALASHRDDIRKVNVTVCQAVASYLNNRKRRDIARIESEANMAIAIRGEEDAPAEHLQIECFDGNNMEIRLLPAPAPANRRGGHH
jgi:ribonuclease E